MSVPPRAPTSPYEPIPAAALDRSLVARFADVVRRYGDQVALRTRASSVTYAALDAMAGRVAGALADARGVGAEPVAVLMPKGVPQLAAFLGVLMAGKIAVPLDGATPPERLRTIVANAGIVTALTDAERGTLVGPLLGAGGVVLDAAAVAERGGALVPARGVGPDAPACILHTSGSTGRPKGVLLTHRAALHQILRITDRYHLAAADRFTWLSDLATGQGVVNAFMALLNGGTLYPWDIRREGLGGLAAWMTEEAITVYRSSTSVFRYFADGLGGSDNFPALRLLTFASEPAYARDVERFRERFARSCLLVNALSTSETGTIATHFVDPDAPLRDRLVPVGHPVDGVEVVLLGEDGSPAAPGEPGEIAVRSRYLPAGYWNEPELTRAAYQPDPDGSDARVYRTGDLGRILSDGALVHLGRRDFQVMIRGFRVETGEVEMALRDHPDVSAAAVVARPDARGEMALTGYVVPARKPGPDASVLREFLRPRLPGPMVPSAFVELDRLPVTVVGKVDRHALPAPGVPVSRGARVAPRTPLEERLAVVWAEVLGVESVGVEDRFLDLGGNSLLATKVVNRVLEDVSTDVSVAALLAASTVSGMALVITMHLAQQLPARLLTEFMEGDGSGAPDATR